MSNTETEKLPKMLRILTTTCLATPKLVPISVFPHYVQRAWTDLSSPHLLLIYIMGSSGFISSWGSLVNFYKITESEGVTEMYITSVLAR